MRCCAAAPSASAAQTRLDRRGGDISGPRRGSKRTPLALVRGHSTSTGPLGMSGPVSRSGPGRAGHLESTRRFGWAEPTARFGRACPPEYRCSCPVVRFRECSVGKLPGNRRRGKHGPPATTRRGRQPRLRPRCCNHGIGLSSCAPGPTRTSKCRCGPVDCPRLPTVAICCPASTRWPTPTCELLM